MYDTTTMPTKQAIKKERVVTGPNAQPPYTFSMSRDMFEENG